MAAPAEDEHAVADAHALRGEGGVFALALAGGTAPQQQHRGRVAVGGDSGERLQEQVQPLDVLIAAHPQHHWPQLSTVVEEPGEVSVLVVDRAGLLPGGPATGVFDQPAPQQVQALPAVQNNRGEAREVGAVGDDGDRFLGNVQQPGSLFMIAGGDGHQLAGQARPALHAGDPGCGVPPEWPTGLVEGGGG